MIWIYLWKNLENNLGDNMKTNCITPAKSITPTKVTAPRPVQWDNELKKEVSKEDASKIVKEWENNYPQLKDLNENKM